LKTQTGKLHRGLQNALCALAIAVVLHLGMLAGSAQTNIYLFSGSETNITLNPGTCIITAYGAPGGGGIYAGTEGLGPGAEMSAEFNFSTSTILTLLVGGGGVDYSVNFGGWGSGFGGGGGGGGGGGFLGNGTNGIYTSYDGTDGNGGGGFGGMFNPNMMAVNNARNVKAPAVEAKALLDVVTTVTLADGVYSGAMTEAGAKARLTPTGFGGRGGGGGGGFEPPEVTGAKGTVKFWIKDGILVKYEYNLKGSMDMMGNPMDIDRTTAVEIKDVGTTKIAVPDDAKKKMS